MDVLIRKACELGEKTAHFRVEVILKATLWMEERYRQSRNPKIAAMIALHYMILAVRQEPWTRPHTVEDYIAQALACWKTASHDHGWQPMNPQRGSRIKEGANSHDTDWTKDR
jgi:hypothetical protein